MSEKTVEAYRRDVSQFLDFLTGHLGSAPTLKRLAGLTPADIRAFMAARRADGTRQPLADAGRWRARARSRGSSNATAKARSARLPPCDRPKCRKTLPKPIAASAARRMTEVGLRAGEAREPWVLARDAAVLALLYGAGLRISEALALKRQDIRAGQDASP